MAPEGLLDKTVVNEVYRVIVGGKKNPNTQKNEKPKRLKPVFKNQTFCLFKFR
jgi:hypothetical protein